MGWEVEGRSFAKVESPGRTAVRFARSHNAEPLEFAATDLAGWKQEAERLALLFPRGRDGWVTRRLPSADYSQLLGSAALHGFPKVAGLARVATESLGVAVESIRLLSEWPEAASD